MPMAQRKQCNAAAAALLLLLVLLHDASQTKTRHGSAHTNRRCAMCDTNKQAPIHAL